MITETVVLKMMPVIAESRKAIISCNLLRVKSWLALDSALSSETSNLKELHLTVKTLHLSVADLKDTEMKSFSALLENPHCKVETLRLWRCGVSDEDCTALTSALRLNPSHLRHLDLSINNLGDTGGMILCDILKNPHCKLETLKLFSCGVSDKGCTALTSALRLNPSHLRHLDLSGNKITDSAKKLLSALKDETHHRLQTLM
ncbi:NACHT, LRR and PYD domains-containing protein 1 [Bagarius yarrelli]|uniref:NACHT, LRR and PYD domains-containing protein 1 n=1 Tax=Bagarius yarrelli TaxID=175774 RepID=A0A556TR20_BAGYA|nr:NACHT, LRR and PYD domains-containing protein 1 [Bagarius yarrelli]